MFFVFILHLSVFSLAVSFCLLLALFPYYLCFCYLFFRFFVFSDFAPISTTSLLSSCFCHCASLFFSLSLYLSLPFSLPRLAAFLEFRALPQNCHSTLMLLLSPLPVLVPFCSLKFVPFFILRLFLFPFSLPSCLLLPPFSPFPWFSLFLPSPISCQFTHATGKTTADWSQNGLKTQHRDFGTKFSKFVWQLGKSTQLSFRNPLNPLCGPHINRTGRSENQSDQKSPVLYSNCELLWKNKKKRKTKKYLLEIAKKLPGNTRE